MAPRVVYGGGFYGRRTASSPLESVGPSPGRPADAWICRRLADYPPGRLPPVWAGASCSRCHAVIVYDPDTLRRTPDVRPDTPKVCMQCAGIQPLPFE